MYRHVVRFGITHSVDCPHSPFKINVKTRYFWDRIEASVGATVQVSSSIVCLRTANHLVPVKLSFTFYIKRERWAKLKESVTQNVTYLGQNYC